MYGLRSLMALCPVPVKSTRTIGSCVRKDAEEAPRWPGKGTRRGAGLGRRPLPWIRRHARSTPHARRQPLRTIRESRRFKPCSAASAFRGRMPACSACIPARGALPRHSRSAAVRNLCGEPLPGARHRPRRARHASCIGPTRRDHRRTHWLGRRTHPVRDSGRAGRRRLRPDVHLVIFPAAHADCHVQDAAATTRGSASIQAPILALGLPEEAFERENNLITASDVRAVILSRLRLPAWGTLWDVGAGSGSVGLERPPCARPSAYTASSATPERCAMIERNRLSMGIATTRCIPATPSP